MADRNSRLDALKSATKDYIKTEKKRVENEVKVLEAVLNGRTGGSGIQAVSVAVVDAVANKDLADYLKGP